jgi:cell division protein FtsI (penicillin-binding protein 3)
MLILAQPRAASDGPVITPTKPPAPVRPLPEPTRHSQASFVALALGALFLAVGAQLVRLTVTAELPMMAAVVEPVAISYSRPDIVDRNGRLLATDVEVHSLYADPAKVFDIDEALEKLKPILPELDVGELYKALSDRERRFVWVRRGLTPRYAQTVHDLGLPGFGFRKELRRVYPLGALAGHILGRVDADNKGTAGIERHIDETVGIDPVHAVRPSEKPPVRLSLDVGAQAGLEAELADAMSRHGAPAAAALVMDANTGEIVAAASLPRVDPARAADAIDPAKKDRLQNGTYELGSIFKMMTLAMALDRGQVTPQTLIDVRTPLKAGRFEIADLHALGRPLTVTEVFLHSSNVGAGMIALEAGTATQRAFLERLGLLGPIKTEAGPVAAPQMPARWDRTETITIAYGHGLAVAPVQFAAAAGALINGGTVLQPTYLVRKDRSSRGSATPVVSAETTAAMRTLMRSNVTEASGTGKRADVQGYEIGGKTGTADIPGPRGYRQGGVISSFLAAFPMSAPRYVALVMLFEPKPTAESGAKVLAGVTAAPVAGRLIARIGPLLAD